MDSVQAWLEHALKMREDIPLPGNLAIAEGCLVNEYGCYAEPVFADEGSEIMGWCLNG